MSSAITLGELVRYALVEASNAYHINFSRYMGIIDVLDESKIQVSTFNEFCSYYNLLLSKLTNHLTIEEYNTLLNNKSTLCAIILNIFNRLV